MGEVSKVKISVISSISKKIGIFDVIELGVDRSTISSNGSYTTLLSDERVTFEDAEGTVINNSAGIPLKGLIKGSITGVSISEKGSGYRYDDVITINGTDAVSYTHLTLPTKA